MNRPGTYTFLISVLLSVLILSLGGCAATSQTQLPKLDIPESWQDGQITSTDSEYKYTKWWTRFNDPVLNKLVEQATLDNPDIRLQAARVLEARSRLGFAKAEQLPTLSAQAEAIRQKQPETTSGIPGGVRSNMFSLAGILDYELDIWGRLSMEREAAESILLENQYAYEVVKLSAISDVVVTYFNLVTAREELDTTRQTISLWEDTLDLQKIRFKSGMVDELVVRQSESALEAVKSAVPLQKQQIRTLEGALGILTGLNPAQLFEDHYEKYGNARHVQNPGPLPMILPAELLNRRPDIRAADAAASTAGLAIGIARAQRLPKINLAALLGTIAPETGDLFSSRAGTWSIGAQAAGPLIDFGRTKSRVETAQAQYVQAEIQYEAAVNMAFNEVRDALIMYESALNQEKAIKRQLETTERTRDLAWIRYQEGMINYIDFLEAERELYQVRQGMNNVFRNKLVAVATLSRALGGGWDPQIS